MVRSEVVHAVTGWDDLKGRLTVVGDGPTVSSLQAASGPPRTRVDIGGSNLGTTTDVKFNGVSAKIRNVPTNGTLVEAVVPVGATTGPVEVTTTGGTATSAGDFMVVGDTSSPVVTISTPAQGESFVQNEEATFDFECTDDAAIVSCMDAAVADGDPIGTSTPGAFMLTVTSMDGSGKETTFTHEYTVVTREDAIDEVAAAVNELVPDVLNRSQAEKLTRKLDEAKQKLKKGKIKSATKKLASFIDKVQRFIDRGVLTSAEGQPLINEAETILSVL